MIFVENHGGTAVTQSFLEDFAHALKMARASMLDSVGWNIGKTWRKLGLIWIIYSLMMLSEAYSLKYVILILPKHWGPMIHQMVEPLFSEKPCKKRGERVPWRVFMCFMCCYIWHAAEEWVCSAASTTIRENSYALLVFSFPFFTCSLWLLRSDDAVAALRRIPLE